MEQINKEIDNGNNTEIDISSLSILRDGKKNKKRSLKLNEICLNFLSLMKDRQMKSFSRNFLNSVIANNKIDKRTFDRITLSILKELVNNGKIKEKVTIQKCTQLLIEPLYSQDYGSFEVLMKKNGYRKNKLLIDDNDLFKGLFEDDEKKVYCWNNSFLSREKQGCFSKGNKSIRNVIRFYPVKTYELIN